MHTEINQAGNGRSASRDYIENQNNNFILNKNYLLVLLIVFLLISLFFNYEFYNQKEKLEKENISLEYKLKLIPIEIKKEQMINSKFNTEKAKKEIDELIK